ncbi:hypothetical protein FNJ84_03430 [Paracoccus sp. M683]|uniref:hypothetical protein n=1 Tax=Paracoccus sp. M683 TaxID=2594268 RepID=UPI0011907F99|nr:hypothetical protein [Paracoccus sp. M683]TRW98623.1 hypothetical protein FNJ84_03430 [Paracoccus sp. M683]
MRRVVAYALAVALGWLALMAGGMFIPGAAPSALVILPSPDLLARLPDAGLVHASRWTATINGVTAGDIYQSRAGWLVLPAGLPLCMALPDR